MSTIRMWAVALVALIGCCGAFGASAAPALAGVEPYGTDNYGDFNDILPPGANGLDTDSGALLAEGLSENPPHSSDQLAMYSNLTTAAPYIQASQIGDYYKSSIFGVPDGDVSSTETPEPGVTVEFDQYDVPHIYGDTRPALMFGIGYVTAQQRLFFIDALRHAGEGDLAQFAGGANVAMDESVWQNEPYTAADRQAQVDYIRDQLPGGAQVYDDAQNYVDGINAYITQMEEPLNTLTMEPGEYALLGITPQPWSVSDLVSLATLVGGIFGVGGGQQLSNAELYEQMVRRFGGEQFNRPGSPVLLRHPKRLTRRSVDHSGFATFMSFDDPADPTAPTTVQGKSFPYQTLAMPSRAELKTIALPDDGSVQPAQEVVAGAVPGGETSVGARVPRRASGGGGAEADAAASAATPSSAISRLASSALLAFPRSMSNALLVSAKHSTNGHPLAVMGPQVGYFSPEILMEEDIHGPGIDAAGAAFPGVNLYVELGHGPDYAWSATSAGQNIVDTFAVPLCNPSGGTVTTSSTDYVLHGRCVPMEILTDHESWQPNLADSTPAGSVTFQTDRTAFGLVIARATVHGRPVAYTNLRSTYMHELDSALGFELYNNPADMQTPQAFMDATSKIGYTFNWFYESSQHIAYFNSGRNPVRAAHTDPLFPSWSTFAWPGYAGGDPLTPANLVERDTPQSAHPQVIDPTYLTSWNNKQAPGYNDTATGQEFSSVYRSQLLNENIDHYLAAGGGKLSLVDLINAMGNAGTQDLRGVEVLPYALKIIGTVPATSPVAGAVAALSEWVATGAHRINRLSPGASGTYQQGQAVQLMDAWWPLLVGGEFGGVLRSPLLSSVEAEYPINDEPGDGTSGAHLGSSFDVGFYGIVQEDLRSVLAHRVVRGGLNRIFCGAGSLRACRAMLVSTLQQAAAEPATEVYPGDSVCKAGDQMCHDAIQFRPIGAIKQPLIEWVNRPTFQQADTIFGQLP